MTNDEWTECDDAFVMLRALQDGVSREAFVSLYPTLHSYLLACCKRIRHLLPQQIFHLGLEAAERYLDGELDRKVLDWLDWHLEAACFAIDNEPNSTEVRGMIDQIDELRHLPHVQAVERLKAAAYFAEAAIIGLFPGKSRAPKYDFLCPDLLRKFLHAPFTPENLKIASPRPLMTNREWQNSDDIYEMIRNLRRLPAEKYRKLQLRETIKRFLLASCEPYAAFLQTPMMQQGLIGAESHFDEPLCSRKRYVLWSNAFDEAGEHDFEKETEENKLRRQVQQLALAAINGSWSRGLSDGTEILSPSLLREFLPAPFDH